MSGLALGLLLSVATPVAADDDDRGGARVVPVRGEIDDRSAPQLLADVGKPFYTVPADQIDPCARLGEDGDVLAPVFGFTDMLSCSATEDTRVLVIFGVTCSDNEPEPWFAEGARAQRACARGLNEAEIRSLHVQVDDGRLVQLDPGQRFRVTSAQVAVTAVAGAPFPLEPGPMTYAADGWVAEVKGLAPGEHTLHLEALLNTGETLPSDVVVTVVADDDDEDDEDDDEDDDDEDDDDDD